MKIKVLIVSRNAWNNSSSNTISNFFQDFTCEELAQVYCRDELPDNSLCTRYFKISESSLFKTLLRKDMHAGEKIEIKNIDEKANELAIKEKRFYDFFRNNRFQLFLWIRELLWETGKWKSPELDAFILEFKPDIIYSDAYDTLYTYNLLNYIKSVADAPYVLFHSDDQVTYRQFSISPFYWINRLLLRKKITTAINNAAINYCIIDKQKEVYQTIFNREFKILNKCDDFNSECGIQNVISPLKLVFAGNIYYGRWKTILLLAESINKFNLNGEQIVFNIYTSNPVSAKFLNKINSMKGVSLNGFRPHKEIIDIQSNSDILLHVESFRLYERLLTALSFSTKLVDYFKAGKCILAIGWAKAASIEYLQRNDAAITITLVKEIENVVANIIKNPKLITIYGQKAYHCGRKLHDKSKVLTSFRNDLISIISGDKN